MSFARAYPGEEMNSTGNLLRHRSSLGLVVDMSDDVPFPQQANDSGRPTKRFLCDFVFGGS